MNCPKTDLAHGKEVANVLGIGLSELPAKPMITCTSSPGKRPSRKGEILELHKHFFYRIDRRNAGVYRKVPVIITGVDFEFPPPSKIERCMEEFVGGIPSLRKEFHPVEYSALIPPWDCQYTYLWRWQRKGGKAFDESGIVAGGIRDNHYPPHHEAGISRHFEGEQSRG